MVAQVEDDSCPASLAAFHDSCGSEVHSGLSREIQYLILHPATGESSKDLKGTFWDQPPDASCKTRMGRLQELLGAFFCQNW